MQFLHSIRFRLVLWFVLILGVVMAMFSFFVYWRQVQVVHTIATARLSAMQVRFADAFREEESSIDESQPLPPGAGLSLVNTAFLEEEDIAAVQNPQGEILQSVGPIDAGQIQTLDLPLVGWNGVEQAEIPKSAPIENNHYLFINPAIQHDGQLVGYLLLGVPLDANNQLGRLLVSLVIGNLLTLAIALSGGFWLADQAMRPVHTITQTARQISETDLHKRLNLAGRDELTELANTFDQMLNRLQAAFERQRQFTADASHELRTPLTIIDLETSRGLAARRPVDEYERILHNIQSENQFMIRLVNNLLSLARMDAGQVSLHKEGLDLGDLTLEVVERMRPLADAQGAKLTFDDLPAIPIQGDRAMLVQMLTNLVENAIKYSANVTQPVIHLSAGMRGKNGQQEAWVRVKDTGIGIPLEQQGHIFDRFYQVEAARTRLGSMENDGTGVDSSGTGLGLAIVQWIVQAHQGEIRVNSEVGQGATFEVVLPSTLIEKTGSTH